MHGIKGIVKETSKLVEEQGGRLDIVGDELLNTYKNMEGVNSELLQANTYQRKSRKKYCICILFVLAIVGFVLFFLVI
jgi:t-SNARE complex subunit (syntaxin)